MNNFKKKPWEKFITSSNEHLHETSNEAAFDLLSQMLTVDHTNRITAKEALGHPFFDEVRQMVLEETFL